MNGTGYTAAIPRQCAHCGQNLGNFSITIVGGGTYHPECLQIVNDANTIAALKLKIDELSNKIDLLIGAVKCR